MEAEALSAVGGALGAVDPGRGAARPCLSIRNTGRKALVELFSFAATLRPILDTEVNALNEQALGFCRRLGFVEIGYSPLNDQGRAYPLIRMWLLAEAIR